VRVGDEPGLVADGVEDILHTALAEELVSGPEGDLDDRAELGELLGGVGLDVGDALKVGDEHLDNLLPSGEPLDENVGGLELMGSSVLLDQALVPRQGRASLAVRPRDGIEAGHLECVSW